MITLRYTCKQCPVVDRELEVPHRHFNEDVTAWMKKVELWLSQDHRRQSPWCRPKQLHNVKIPTEGRQYVGGPLTQ